MFAKRRRHGRLFHRIGRGRRNPGAGGYPGGRDLAGRSAWRADGFFRVERLPRWQRDLFLRKVVGERYFHSGVTHAANS
jgi:hypothetical protein